MNRTLVIGDIHGGYYALLQIMERAQVTTQDRLIFLGDYADGWSQTPDVLDFLIDLKQTHDCIFMRGNHDDLLLQWMDGAEDNLLWTKHGGAITILAYKLVDDNRRERHVEFLSSLRDYYLDDRKRLFVHAGFTSLHGVKHEYTTRLFYWDRTLWETALAMDPNLSPDDAFYPKRFQWYSEIFIGHTPVTRIGSTVPVQRANIWNVDTGAAFHGPLTIMDVDSKQFWQSDPLPQLYPHEDGRNA